MDGWMDGIDLNCQLQPLFCARAGAHRHHRYPVNFTYTNRRRHHQEHRPIPPQKRCRRGGRKTKFFSLQNNNRERKKESESERKRKEKYFPIVSLLFWDSFFSFFFKSYLFLSP
jgi:hypothetical protein